MSTRLDFARTNLARSACALLLLTLSGCGDSNSAPDTKPAVLSQNEETTPPPLPSQPSVAPAVDIPPEIDFTDVDPVVVRVIRQQAESVRQFPNKADVWGKLGMLLETHDFHLPAAQVLARASQLDPTDTRWHHYRGVALENIAADEAIASFRLAAENDSNVASVSRLWLAELLIRVARDDEAAVELKTFLQKSPNVAWAHMLAARVAYAQQDLEATLAHLAKVKPPRQEALRLQAEVELRKGNVNEAKSLRATAEQTGNYPWPDPFSTELAKVRTGLKVLLSRSDSMYGQNKVEQSLELAQIAVREYPDSDWAKILAGRALIRLRRYDEAESVLDAAIAANPQLVEAYFRRGVIYFNRKEFDKAIVAYEKTVELKPDFTLAYMNLGFCHQNQENWAAAREAFTSATAVDPVNVDAWIMVGEAENKLGHSEKARKAWETANTLRPNDSGILNRLKGLDVDTSFDASDLFLEP